MADNVEDRVRKIIIEQLEVAVDKVKPEATFSDLATRLGIHRSSVQRALERIERLALHPDEGAGRRRGARE